MCIRDSSEGVAHLAVRSGDGLFTLRAVDGGMGSPLNASESSVISSSGPLLAVSGSLPDGPVVNITSIDSDLIVSISLDPRSDERTEQSLADAGAVLNFQNATVVDLEMDSPWLVATVDVGPFSRTLLVDTITFNQTLISNPLWDSSSPSIANGKVAFLEVTGDAPWDPDPEDPRNSDVILHDLEDGTRLRITSDEDVDQSQPQVLDNGVAWIEESEGGDSDVEWYPFEDAIEPYSSLLLQASVLALLPLLFLWAHQSARPDRNND